MKSKNSFLVALSFVLIGIIGCGENESTLSIIGEDSATLNSIIDLKEEYEKETGVKINIVKLSFEEAIEKSYLDLSNHTGLYDIVMQYNFSLSSFVRNNYVYSLDDLTKFVDKSSLDFENDLFQSGWEEVGYYYKDFKNPGLGFQKVGYPFASNTRLLVYNKEWFNNPKYKSAFKAKYGKDLTIPKTWDEVIDIAEFFTQPKKDMYGICLEGSEGGWLYYQWVDMLYGLGGKVMDKNRAWEGDENTSIYLDSPEAQKAMEMLKSLKPFNKGEFFEVDMYKQKDLFKEGNVAIAMMWSDILYELVDLTQKEHQFAFAPVPGNLSINAGGAFFINKDSKNANEAMKFITWVMKEENQLKMLEKGHCSPLKNVYSNPNVQHIPYLKALKESLDRGVYMAEAGPDADVVSESITTIAQKVWRNEIESQEAIKMLQNKVVNKRKETFENINNN